MGGIIKMTVKSEIFKDIKHLRFAEIDGECDFCDRPFVKTVIEVDDWSLGGSYPVNICAYCLLEWVYKEHDRRRNLT